MTCAGVKQVNLQRRVLLFEGAHVTVQKLIFLLLKVGYYFMDDIRLKSDMVNYAIPFNLICAVLTITFITLKFRDLRLKTHKESIEGGSDELIQGNAKKFES